MEEMTPALRPGLLYALISPDASKLQEARQHQKSYGQRCLGNGKVIFLLNLCPVWPFLRVSTPVKTKGLGIELLVKTPREKEVR